MNYACQKRDELAPHIQSLSRWKYNLWHGKYNYRNGDHKISSPDKWYDFEKYVVSYPGVVYKSADPNSYIRPIMDIEDVVEHKVVRLINKKRNAGVELFFTTPVTEAAIIFDAKSDRWRTPYEMQDFVYEEDSNDNRVYYRVSRVSEYYVLNDEAFRSLNRNFVEWYEEGLRIYHAPVAFTKENKEEKEMACKNNCRRSHCYCDESKTLTYEVNEHSMEVEVTKGFRTMCLTLDECAELSSFLASAKTKIKEARIAALKEQQDALSKQLAEVQSL